jgi:lipopolysaccharide heptosyltransferase II
VSVVGAGRGWERAANLLAVRLDTLGDVVMTAPALDALRAPGRTITLLTSPGGAEVAELIDAVDDTIVYDAPWLKATAPRRDSAPDHDMIGKLRARAFDAAIIFTVYSQNPLPSALLCHLADVPLRLAHCRENPYGLLTDWVPEREPDNGVRHEVRRQLDLVATIGSRRAGDAPLLTIPTWARATVGHIVTEHGLDGRPWVVIHPGASASSRRYSPEGYAAVARDLADTGHGIVLTGSAAEAGLLERVRALSGAPALVLAGRLRVAELAALLERAPVLVSNNTGPVHVACAVGTPVVDLYALTNPQHTPWGVPHRVLFHDVPCRWCLKSVCPEGHHNCLRLVSPDAVVAAVRDLLSETRGPSQAPGDARIVHDDPVRVEPDVGRERVVAGLEPHAVGTRGRSAGIALARGTNDEVRDRDPGR